MPRRVRDPVRAIEADGWRLIRVRGSHRQFHHPSKAGTVTIAGTDHQELPPKTERSILRRAGLEKVD